LIVKYLRYQPVKILNTKFEKKIRYGITALILVMIIPSFYLAYNLLQEKKYRQNVEQFITNEFTNNGYTLVYKQTKFNSNPKKIELAFLTEKFTDDEIKSLNQRLNQYNITNTKLIIKQDSKDLKGEILNELGNQNKILSKKDILINNLQNELSEYKIGNAEIINEISILFPELRDVSFGKHTIYPNTDSTKTFTVLLYQTDDAKNEIDLNKLDQWIKQKFKTNNIKIVRQQ
jgi:hypothetical protein